MISYTDVYKIGDSFSITGKFSDWIGNPEWADGYKRMISSEDEISDTYTPFWEIVSAVSDDIGSEIYSKVRHFIQNVRDIDTCESKYLYAIAQELGYGGNIDYLVYEYPKEVEQLVDIFSINKDILLKSHKILSNKSRNAIFQSTSAELPTTTLSALVSSDPSWSAEELVRIPKSTENTVDTFCYTDDDAYLELTETLFAECISGYTELAYRDYELGISTPLSGGIIWKHIVNDLLDNKVTIVKPGVTDLIVRLKASFNIPTTFNEVMIVNNIQNNKDQMSNYTSAERKIIDAEFERRSIARVKEIPVSRYSQERENKVREYFGFVELFSSNNMGDFTHYEVGSGMMELTGTTVIGLIDTLHTPYELDSDLILTTASNLRNICVKTSYLREELKRLLQKYHLTGTELIIKMLTKDFIRRHIYDLNSSRYNTTSGTNVMLDPVAGNSNLDVSVIEYYDTTEYLNIETRFTPPSSQVNPEYWLHDSTQTTIDNLAIEKFYKNTIGLKFNTQEFDLNGSQLSYDDQLTKFLTSIYRFGAVVDTTESITETITVTGEDLVDFVDGYHVPAYLVEVSGSTEGVSGVNTSTEIASAICYIPTETMVPSTTQVIIPTSTTIEMDNGLIQFNKYTGDPQGDTPYVNSKNVTHPSYAVHPYMSNLYEKTITDELIGIEKIYNFITESDSINTSGSISLQIDADGNTIDSWRSQNIEYTGYQTTYESADNNASEGVKDPQMDIDGPFYYDALSEFINNPTTFTANLTASPVNDYYDNLGLESDELSFIQSQLREFKPDILALSGKVIAKYSVDGYGNNYILYKDDMEFDTPGELWVRWVNHPMCLPAFKSEVSGTVAGDVNIINKWSQFSDDNHTNISEQCAKIYDFGIYGTNIWLATNDNINTNVVFGNVSREYNDSLSRWITFFNRDQNHNFEYIDCPTGHTYAGVNTIQDIFVTSYVNNFTSQPQGWNTEIRYETYDPDSYGHRVYTSEPISLEYNVDSSSTTQVNPFKSRATDSTLTIAYECCVSCTANIFEGFVSDNPTSSPTNGRVSADVLRRTNVYNAYDNGITMIDLDINTQAIGSTPMLNIHNQVGIHTFFRNVDLGCYLLSEAPESGTIGTLDFSKTNLLNSSKINTWSFQYIGDQIGTDPNVFTKEQANFPFDQDDLQGAEHNVNGNSDLNDDWKELEQYVTSNNTTTTSGDINNVGRIILDTNITVEIRYIQGILPNDKTITITMLNGTSPTSRVFTETNHSKDYTIGIRKFTIELIDLRKLKFTITETTS